jgi:hypothetical protein
MSKRVPSESLLNSGPLRRPDECISAKWLGPRTVSGHDAVCLQKPSRLTSCNGMFVSIQ